MNAIWPRRQGRTLPFLLLKRERSHKGPPPTLLARLAAGLLLPLLVPAALVLTSWRAWIGKGAVVTFLARKGEPPAA